MPPLEIQVFVPSRRHAAPSRRARAAMACTSEPASGSLTAMITARVTQVLPNGDLVLEGIREVDINGDRRFIVLSGIVRPYDISPGNIVSSAAVGQMQIRYFGRGLIRDNLKPGWLVRFINKVF